MSALPRADISPLAFRAGLPSEALLRFFELLEDFDDPVGLEVEDAAADIF
jgi:hypothetical protein